MRRMIAVLALAVLAAACSDDAGGDRYADVEEARVRIVSGDGQSAPVATAPERSGDIATLGSSYTPAQADLYDVFPEVLEVEVTDAGGPSASVSGPSFAIVPAGTDVHWLVREEGCGRPVGQTTATNDQGRAINRWIRGTKATTCHMDVCRILSDGGLACDTTFTAVQSPGPIAFLFADQPANGSVPAALSPGDSIDARLLVYGGRDAYLNDIPLDSIRALPDSMVGWAWHDSYGTTEPDTATDFGWIVVAPSFDGYRTDNRGIAALGLRLWVGGARSGTINFAGIP